MIVTCDKCDTRYDDEYRWTFCPHKTFDANDGANNFTHHPESFIESSTRITSFLEFVDKSVVGRKTKLIEVWSKGGPTILGFIKWYGPWRKYCFYPADGTIFDPSCLLEIAAHTGNLTWNHKHAAKIETASPNAETDQNPGVSAG